MSLRTVERDQLYLMPPSLAEWLPEDHLAYFVLDAVETLDLASIRSHYSSDGPGAPAYDPEMMLAIWLYAYCAGLRSSRRIEAACVTDVGFRVIAANQRPDHATLARFRAAHQGAIADLFVQVLGLCAAAGLTKMGLVAIDGTKMGADASEHVNRTAAQLRADIEAYLSEVATTDAAEDAALGDRRGDEWPEGLADRSARRARLAAAKAALEAAEATRRAEFEEMMAQRAARKAAGERIRGRTPRFDAKARSPRREPRVNLTDPDSRLQRVAGKGFLQGYNAQVAVDDNQIVIAAVVVPDESDSAQLNPMTAAAVANATAAGCAPIGTVLADAGYISEAALAGADPDGPGLLVAGRNYPGQRRGQASMAMAEKMALPASQALYRRRSPMVESVFGHTKANRGMSRFARRGLAAVDSEWKFIHLTANLMKLFRSGIDVAGLVPTG